MDGNPTCYSFVVCSYNGSRTIGACLDSLLHQTIPAEDYEIIVVDDGSSDGVGTVAQQILKTAPHARIISLEHSRGLSAARNRGWQAARGAIVLYLDDDAIADPDWIEKITGAYDADIAGVGGLPRPFEHTIFSSYDVGMTLCEYGPRAECMQGAGGNNMSFRRTVLDAIGGFDERFTAVADDADINRRLLAAGHRLVVLPDITVRHHTPTGYRSFWIMKVGRGKGGQIFREKYQLRHSPLHAVMRIVYYLYWFPIHLVLGWRVARAVREPQHALHFALLHWLERVASAWGAYQQSARWQHSLRGLKR